MLVKYQALAQALQKTVSSMYILIGQEHYLNNEAALSIKKTWRQKGNCDEKVLDIHSAQDWSLILDEANHYTLFSELTLLDVRYDKKTLDNTGKKVLQDYLTNVNPKCLIILRAPQLSTKQLTFISSNNQVTLVQIYPFNPATFKTWIETQLQSHLLLYERNVPELIYQYTQNNMLAAAQIIEKLALIYEPKTLITSSILLEQLIQQSDFSLYELADACLLANGLKVIQILQHAKQTKAEPTLILWLLTQEIRQLIQLKQSTRSFAESCSQLKIWAQRIPLYEKAIKRISLDILFQALRASQNIDECIKSNQNNFVWQKLEQLSLVLVNDDIHSKCLRS